MNTENTSNLAAQYAAAVQCERAAWQALQAQSPGSDGRTQAWSEWTEAIARTNTAWRRLSSSTLSQPHHQSGASTEARPRHREAGPAPRYH